MAIARLAGQDCSNSTTNGTSISTTYASVPTQNNLLIAGALLSTTVAHVTIPSGWTTKISLDNSGGYCVLICFKVAGASESQGVNFNMAGQSNGDVVIAAYEYSGLLSVSPSDQLANNAGGSFVNTFATGTTGTTAQANELVFSLVGLSGSGTSPSSANGTLLNNVGNLLFTAQRIVSAVGTYSDTFSWTSNNVPTGLIATFKALADPVGKVTGARQAVNRAVSY